MAYMELEQFLGRGNEKVFWVLSLKDMGGLALGGFVGQRLGAALVGSGAALIVVTLFGAALGLGLMLQYHGLVVGRRLALLARYLLRRLRGRGMIDQAMYNTATSPDDGAWAGRRDGRIRVRSQVDNRPIFGPRGTLHAPPTEPQQQAPSTTRGDSPGATP